MPLYEAMFILRAGNTPRLRAFLSQTVTQITLDGGLVQSFENMGTRELPHRAVRHMEKFDKGVYMVMNFYYSAEKLREFQNSLNLNQTVVRASVIKTMNHADLEDASYNIEWEDKPKKKIITQCERRTAQIEDEVLEDVFIIDKLTQNRKAEDAIASLEFALDVGQKGDYVSKNV